MESVAYMIISSLDCYIQETHFVFFLVEVVSISNTCCMDDGYNVNNKEKYQ